MQDLEYIKRFKKITVTGICRKLNINRSNLYNGRTTKKNERAVREQIESEVAKLYIKDDNYVE